MSTEREIERLVERGLVPAERAEALRRVAARWSVALTPAVAGRIDPADPHDPLVQQFVPSEQELAPLPDELEDPIGDLAHQPVPGIVHRYPDRVLLLPTHACAVYCRFCFRRERVGPGAEALTPAELERALAYVAGDPRIWEVILSGGDPLVLSPRRLGEIVRRLDELANVQVIRVHTRVPVLDPERVGDALLSALSARKALWLVLHVNHARELGPGAREACARLARAGIPLLAQTVLLAGVNDTPAALEELFRALVALRVKPYYLHHLDRAPGTARFRTSLAAGQELVRGLRGRISGLCQPTYVLDIPGGAGKVPIGPSHLGEARDGVRELIDWQGKSHLYVDRDDAVE
ncbi:MAG TPA: lysine-2,3-aminomutase-like protein [Myxococcota bacterium]|nr:lysine-2,3-aminomutase-like protein [Myxococcota bacterium]